MEVISKTYVNVEKKNAAC